MRNDFRVGFRGEFMALFYKLALQGEIILDDAVMRDDDAAFAVAMRMGILLGRTPMSSPTRMAKTELSRYRLLLKQILQIFEFAGTPPDLKLLVFNNRDSGRIVAAILE